MSRPTNNTIISKLAVLENKIENFGSILSDNNSKTEQCAKRISEMNGFLPEINRALKAHIEESKVIRDKVSINSAIRKFTLIVLGVYGAFLGLMATILAKAVIWG